MTARRSNEKKMVKRGTSGASYSYYPICNIDDIALRAAVEFYTETGHGNTSDATGMNISVERIDLRFCSVEVFR